MKTKPLMGFSQICIYVNLYDTNYSKERLFFES